MVNLRIYLETITGILSFRVLTFEGSFFIYPPILGSSQYEDHQAKIVEKLPSPKQDDTDVVNAKSR